MSISCFIDIYIRSASCNNNQSTPKLWDSVCEYYEGSITNIVDDADQCPPQIDIVKELRKEAGYTSQETFAYDAEIPRALYGKYEKGANITINSLHRILKFHNITFKEFFKKGFENY